MSGLFGAPKVQQPQSALALTIQQSSYGTPVTLLYGTNRVYGNLLWYGAFNQVQQSNTSGSGKGGVVGGGGKGGGSGSYQYYASFAIGLCEGPISSVNNVYVSKQTTNLSELISLLFTGTQGQTPWGYLTTNFPAYALSYTELAYAGFPNFSLGTSSETPQFSFETSGLKMAGNGNQDASPDQVFIDFLTRSGLPASYIDTFSACATYWQANNFYISPLFDQQRQASDWLKEIMDTLNAEFVWYPSQGYLSAVTYGDTTASANGVNFVPNLSPIYSLTDDDFIRDGDVDPITCTRSDLSDVYNQVPIEYVNRSDQYNVETYQAFDDSLTDTFGFRVAPTMRAHHITDPNIAQQMATLWMNHQIYTRNTYTFKLPWNYILLDPMDVIEINDVNLGLNNALVRIVEIEEDEKDGMLTFTCEEIPGAIAGSILYPNFGTTRNTPNYNQSPGNINMPVFFESPLAFLQAATVEVDIGISGASPLWGGCNVWVSTDGVTYQFLQQFNAKSRMGVLTSALPNFTQTPGANNIDNSDTLAVNMTESAGLFNNAATNADATNLNTLCYVDGELICYGNDVLTNPYQYSLTYLNRGCYGSTISAHASGANFVRFDTNVLRYDVDQSYVGKILYFKFASFNAWGGGVEDVSDLTAYQYQIQGTALLTPLAPPTGLSVSYTANIATLNWNAITDIRTPILYQVRKGTNFASAQIIGYTTQTNLKVWGTDTYWVSAYYQTPLGIAVYSSPQVSVMVATPNLAQNVVGTYDEATTGWTGAVSGAATLTGGNIVVGGPGNILSDPDINTTADIITYGVGTPSAPTPDIISDPDIITTADVLNYSDGTVAASGTYTIPTGHIIAAASVVRANVTCNWAVNGFNAITNDIISLTDILSVQDIFNGALNASVYAQPQISLSQDGTNFGAWQNWVPGTYQFQKINFRIIIESFSSQVQAVLTDFNYSVDIPQSVFTGTLSTSASGATPVTFPGSYVYNTTPIVAPTIVNAQAGDVYVLTSVTTSGFSIEVLNSGSAVVRTVNWTSTGY